MTLRKSVEEIIPQLEIALDDLLEAIESADVDGQRAALAALVSLVETLKSAAIHDPE